VHVLATVVGVVLIAVVLWETFETLVLPRRVSRRVRLTRFYFRWSWSLWKWIGGQRTGPFQETYLSIYAPLSLLWLFAWWASGVVVGFALLAWGIGAPLAVEGTARLGTYLYFSATTFVTLGLGDVTPASHAGRLLTVVEAGMGFAFLALAISYLPVMYQAFSRREARIAMLDQWAGSPPSGVELLRRAAQNGEIGSVGDLLGDWEVWSAEFLESHLSYPILAYFRSQHERESWLAALTAILDTSALVLAGVEGVSRWQAKRTFAMARHAVVDLAQVLYTGIDLEAPPRLPEGAEAALRSRLEVAGVRLTPSTEAHLAAFRRMYEPYVAALSRRLRMPVEVLVPDGAELDAWQTSPWSLPD
jgi:Ion channel